MKRCPECRRDYYDDTLSFCLDDGSRLLDGPAAQFGVPPSGGSLTAEPATAILSEPPASVGGMDAANDTTRIFNIDSANAKPPKGGTQDNSIAVLPFVNMSADVENEYFCDGLADELLNALGKISKLKVAARTSAFSFKGKNIEIGQIGNALNVKTVLEGSVRKSGNKLRITVQLINAADGYHLWSERYDREMKDIFEVQDEITLAVVDALKLKLLGQEKATVLKRHTENTDAYQAYLKGRFLRHTKNDHGGALRAFAEAVRLDPSHAPSWVGVAEGTVLAAHYALMRPGEACDRARAALATARQMQGETADALYVEGFIGFIQRDWAAAERGFRRALELVPDHVHASGSFGLILCVLGRLDEALVLFEHARAIDPLAAFPYAITGAGYGASGNASAALDFLEQASIFGETNLLMLWGGCMARMALGQFEAGVADGEKAARLSQRAPFFLGLLGWACAVAGRPEEARSVLSELQAHKDTTQVSEAWLLGALGEIDAAFDVLKHAEEENQAFICYVQLAGFYSLRSDPRFLEMVHRLDLPEPLPYKEIARA